MQRGKRAFGVRCVVTGVALTLAACSNGGHESDHAIQAQRDLTFPTGDTFFPIGPAPITGVIRYVTNSSPSSTQTGRATVIAVNPAKTDELYVGTAGGGIWHTKNALDPEPIWSASLTGTDTFGSSAIGAIAVVPTACTATGIACGPAGETCGCSVIWAGTGEGSRRRDTLYGAGVYRFADRGGGGEFPPPPSFTEVAGTKTAFYGENVFAILPESDTAAVVLVSEGVTANSTDATVVDTAPASPYGVYRLTDTGGGSITQLPVAGVGSAIPSSLVRPAGQLTTLLVGYTGLGIFRSTDSGGSWCGVNAGATNPCPGASFDSAPPAGFTAVKLATAPSDAQTVYASFGTCFDRAGFSCTNADVLFRSADAGVTWHKLALTATSDSDQGNFIDYPGYANTLVVNPTNANDFVFGGLTLFHCPGSAGSNAFSCAGFGSVDVHPDIHDFVSVGASTMYVASDGGIYVSQNGGSSFTTGGLHLGSIEFDSIATNPLTNEIIGGLQDNSGARFNGTNNWHKFLVGGDGGDTVLDVVTESDGKHVIEYGLLDQATSIQRADNGAVVSSTPPITGEDVAFFAPLEQNPNTHDLYFGAQSLFRSTDTGSVRGNTWEQISDPRASTPVTFPDIDGLHNVITAIGVSLTSGVKAVYVGYYDGQVWENPAPDSSKCGWVQIADGSASSPIPAAPITSITLGTENASPPVAYVTVSGFAAGPHVFKYTPGGSPAWTPFAQGLPSEPANVIRVVPGAPSPGEFWLGTESGLFHSTDAATWSKEDETFPNVAVWDISVDTGHNRVVVATHGRGAWVHTDPVLWTEEGWTMGTIWDIPTHGKAFVNSSNAPITCTMDLIQQNGNVCASGSVDAIGGTIQITAPDAGTGDPGGTLVTSNNGAWNNLPAAWGCFNGTCLNNTPISHCNFVLDSTGNPTSVKNPVTSVRVTCMNGSVQEVAVAKVNGAPAFTSPPPNIFTIDVPPQNPKVLSRTGAPQKSAVSVLGSAAAAPVEQDVVGVQSSFDLAVTLQAGAAITSEICHTHVLFNAGELPEVILARGVDQLNAEADCISGGVFATFVGDLESDDDREDSFDEVPYITVTGPTLVGSRLLVTMRVSPGAALGSCFTAGNLLSSVVGQSTIMKVTPITATGGAQGGTLRMLENTSIGTCSKTLTTTAGQTATDLAQAIVAAFNTNGIPGPPDCLSDANARDLSVTGNAVFAANMNQVTLCTSDPGVGFVVGPEEIDLTFNKPPVAQCKNVTLSANNTCKATVARADVDAGSFDPDGPTPNCVPSPAGPFGLGPHNVTLTCTDADGASASCPAVVTVVDNTPPVMNCPGLVNTTCTSRNGAVATFTATASDNCGVVGTPVCSPTSGTTFALGTRLDTCTVSDTSGNPSSCAFYVSVVLGDDPVCCPTGTNIILGSSNNDTLNGTSGRDCILGRGGQDTINGNGGDDVISGGEGNDIISGGIGNDLIFGGGGQDRITGDAGNDVIIGGDGDDQCSGGDNDDTVLGGQGQDRLTGDAGNDTLAGETGDDNLDGGDGNDSLRGGGLHDVCLGGPGVDTFFTCETQTQ